MGALQTDVRYAVRSLARAPLFVLVAVLALGAGTGGVTAMFSVLYGTLMRPLAYAEADRLVVLQTSRGADVFPALSRPDLDDVRTASRELADIGTWRIIGGYIGGEEVCSRTQGSRTSLNAGVEPWEGRLWVLGRLEVASRPSSTLVVTPGGDTMPWAR